MRSSFFELLGSDLEGEGAEGADVLSAEFEELNGKFPGEVLTLIGKFGEIDDEAVHSQRINRGREIAQRICSFFSVDSLGAEMEQIPPHVLLGAYTEGVFPMAEEGEVLWFSPLMRGMIPLDENFHVPHSLERRLRNNPFEIRIDTAFREVMENCGQREETWIDPVIIDSYCELHDLGFAHSVECWDEEGLQGGLYGVSLGKAFFGESMFSKKTDASKVALVHLVEWLRRRGVILLDTQWMTDHLRQFGGVEIPREEYLKLLDEALQEMGESDQES